MSLSNPPGGLSYKLRDYYGLNELPASDVPTSDLPASEKPRPPQPPPPPPQRLVRPAENQEAHVDVEELLRTKSLSELMKIATDSANKARTLETQLQVMLQDKYQTLFRTMAGLAAMEQVAAAATSSANQAATAAALMADTEEIVKNDTYPKFNMLAEALEQQETLRNLNSLAVMPKELNERIVQRAFEEGLTLLLESKVLARHSRREIPGMEGGRIRDFVQALSAQCNSCVEGIGADLRRVEFWVDPSLVARVSESMACLFKDEVMETAVSEETAADERRDDERFGETRHSGLSAAELLERWKWPVKTLRRDCFENLSRLLSLLTNVAISIDGFELAKMKAQMTSDCFTGFRGAVEHFIQSVLNNLQERNLLQGVFVSGGLILSINESIKLLIERLSEKTDRETADKLEHECHEWLWQPCTKAIETILMTGDIQRLGACSSDTSLRRRGAILEDLSSSALSVCTTQNATDFTKSIFSYLELVHLDRTMRPSCQSCISNLLSLSETTAKHGVELQAAIEEATIQKAEQCCDALLGPETAQSERTVAMIMCMSTALPLLFIALAKFVLDPEANGKGHESSWFAEVALQVIEIPGHRSEPLQTFALSSLMTFLDTQMTVKRTQHENHESTDDSPFFDLIFACEILTSKVFKQLRALARRYHVDVWDPTPLSAAVQETSTQLQEQAIAMRSRRLVSAIELCTSSEMLSLCEDGHQPAVGSVMDTLHGLSNHLELKGSDILDCEFVDLYNAMFTANGNSANAELNPQMLKIEIGMKSLPDILLKLTRGIQTWQRKLLTTTALTAWKLYADEVVRSQSEDGSASRDVGELYIPTIVFLMTQTANLLLDASALRGNRKGRDVINYLLGIVCNITAASVPDSVEGGLKDLQWIRWSQERAADTCAKVKQWCAAMADAPSVGVNQ